MGHGAVVIWSSAIFALCLSYGMKRWYPVQMVQARPYLFLFTGNLFALISIRSGSAATLLFGVALFGYGYFQLYKSHAPGKPRH